jgi:predicted RNase H-like HicB family nuclease
MSEYTIILDSDEEGNGYTVAVPTLPGCITQGKTKEEAIERAKEAIALYIESLAADGEPIPEERRSIESIIVGKGAEMTWWEENEEETIKWIVKNPTEEREVSGIPVECPSCGTALDKVKVCAEYARCPECGRTYKEIGISASGKFILGLTGITAAVGLGFLIGRALAQR